MDTNKHSETKPSLPSGLALIEKIQELRWTLQLAVAVLFADLVLVWRTGQGVTQWSVRTDLLLANSGFVLVSVLVFGLLMSIVIPLVAEIFRWIGWELLINIPWPSWIKTDTDYQRPLNGVTSHELRDHAQQNNDHRLWEIADAHEQKQNANRVSNLAAGQLAFSILLLALLDFKPSLIGLTGVTMLKEVTLSFGQLGELALAVGAILTAIAIKKTWFKMAPPTWISYKPLYDEIEEKRRRRP